MNQKGFKVETSESEVKISRRLPHRWAWVLLVTTSLLVLVSAVLLFAVYAQGWECIAVIVSPLVAFFLYGDYVGSITVRITPSELEIKRGFALSFQETV
jgi:hypothetical protein